MNAIWAAGMPFPHLWSYLCNTSWASAVQFLLLSMIVYAVADRSLRKLRVYGAPLRLDEPVADELVQGLTQLNLGLGLLLTFSGVYGLIGAGEGPDGDWSLLLALGSSALGYSAYAVCSLGSIVDSFVQSRSAK